MLFRKKDYPSPKALELLPDLCAYLKARAVSQTPSVLPDSINEQPSSSEGVRYSIPADTGKPKVQYSIAFEDDWDRESGILDTYSKWEKQNSVLKSFSSEAIRLMNQKYTKPSLFYHAAGIDKRTFHKIKTDYGYKPSRKTAFRCCVGLRLAPAEAEELLKLAGYALSPSEPMDLILRFCLENGIWDIADINYLLSSFDLEDLDM